MWGDYLWSWSDQPGNTKMTEDTLPHNEEIAGVLRDEILRGQYRPGERLPSERDLAARFEVSRGGIREALKRLDQLGITKVQPGGVRVVPLEEATLDVLGPLLDLKQLPDPDLVDQTLEVMSALMVLAARQAVERADEGQMQKALTMVRRMEAESTPQLENIAAVRELMLHFVEASNNLVIRLVVNGLKPQFLGRLQALELRPAPNRAALTSVYRHLERGLAERNGATTADAIDQLNRLMRESLMRSMNEVASSAIVEGVS